MASLQFSYITYISYILGVGTKSSWKFVLTILFILDQIYLFIILILVVLDI